MVSDTKIGRGSILSMGSSTELRFWGAGADELLELLEEVLENILNQMKTPKNPKKIRKNRKQGARKETERAECGGKKIKEQQEKEGFQN